eukprot:389329-Pelagomonas_calceolata.AAC.2
MAGQTGAHGGSCRKGRRKVCLLLRLSKSKNWRLRFKASQAGTPAGQQEPRCSRDKEDEQVRKGLEDSDS